MVVTEALAVGLPVIGAAVGGVPEALGRTTDGVPGLLVPPDDADALREALGNWLGDAGLRKRLRRRPTNDGVVGGLGCDGALRRRRAGGAAGEPGRLPPAPGRASMSGGTRRTWTWARPLGGAAILAVLVWRLGTGPFLDGLRLISVWSLLAATSITVLTTVCSAWRWQTVARGLGVGLPLGTAVAAYYRSQFLNSTLPGGVVGDVHRGVRRWTRGTSVAACAPSGGSVRPARSCSWCWPCCRCCSWTPRCARRWAGSWPPPSPVHSRWPSCCGPSCSSDRPGGRGSSGPRAPTSGRRSRPTGVARRHGHLGGRGPRPRQRLPGRGVDHGIERVAVRRLWPLAMLVLLAMVVPLHVGGWGPREGVAAWAFAAAGLGAAQGVTGHGLRRDGTRRDDAGCPRARRRPDPSQPGPAPQGHRNGRRWRRRRPGRLSTAEPVHAAFPTDRARSILCRWRRPPRRSACRSR